MKNTITRGYTIVAADGVEFDIALTITADMSRTSATMYDRNGDPGSPAESECDITDIEVVMQEGYDQDDQLVTLDQKTLRRYIDEQLADVIEEDLWEDFVAAECDGSYDY